MLPKLWVECQAAADGIAATGRIRGCAVRECPR
jgi:hypothetical protein